MWTMQARAARLKRLFKCTSCRADCHFSLTLERQRHSCPCEPKAPTLAERSPQPLGGSRMHYGQVEGTDLVVLDKRFGQLFAGYMRVTRHWTGSIWAEGPAWFAAGRYLIWSDIPNNRMLRFVEESGQVSVFRQASNNSNGNTVDNQGRLVTCEHLTRRVTRTEFDGSIKVLADKWEGKRFNSPNDAVVKSDEFDLVYRPGLRHRRRQRGRAGDARDRRLLRLSHRQERRDHEAHRQHGAAKRHRLLARREAALCRGYRGDA